MACINQRCQDPCSVFGACGRNALCQSENHRAFAVVCQDSVETRSPIGSGKNHIELTPASMIESVILVQSSEICLKKIVITTTVCSDLL
jgi:hypothetical protein